jgi:hypothetical protein
MEPGSQSGQSSEQQEDSLSAVTHEMVLIPRRQRGDEVAVRTPDGMEWKAAAAYNRLPPQVCQVCGYGPTELQEERSQDGRPVTHRATPLAALPW